MLDQDADEPIVASTNLLTSRLPRLIGYEIEHEKGEPEAAMDIAKLALEDGTVFTGKAFGARGESDGEVVFNTSMTGYQEILTDPSYHGQIVAMTYPQIGNYGVNAEDAESRRPWVRGFVIRELSGRVSNYRAGARWRTISRNTASSASRGSTPALWFGTRGNGAP